MEMARWSSALAAVCLGTGVLAACGSDEERGDRDAFCAAVAIYATSVENGLEDSADDAFELMREQAPGPVHDAFRTMDENAPNSVRVSEQEAFDSANARVNEYIRNDCDLDVTL